jgi:hypothetical protein
MEKINKKLEELKKEVYYAKHADLSIIDKIDVKVKELDKLIKNHGDIGDVIVSVWTVKDEYGVIWHLAKNYEEAMSIWNKSQSEYPHKTFTIETEDL